MKALSLWQFWASAMAVGAKLNETRGKRTSHRGDLLIHASLRSGTAIEEIQTSQDFGQLMLARTPGLWRPLMEIGQGTWDKLPRGCLLGVCELWDCVPTERFIQKGKVPPGPASFFPVISEIEQGLGNYGRGRFAYRTRNMRRFKTPIPWKGAQYLFEVPNDVAAEALKESVVVS